MAAMRIDSEIRTIRAAFSRMAQKIPLALRFMKMLDDESKGDMLQSRSLQSPYYEHIPESSMPTDLDSARVQPGYTWPTLQPTSFQELGRSDEATDTSLLSETLGTSEEIEQLFQFDPFSTFSQ